MNGVLICIVLLSVSVFVFSSDNGAPCTTPNGENATCISFDSCILIREAVSKREEGALEFFQKSKCGFNEQPLVCCGSTAFPKEEPPQVHDLPDRSRCGYEKGADRVFGGETTEIGEFPWMGLLGYKSNYSEEIEFKCGGTLINNRYVLTAAHCIRSKRRAGVTLHTVRLGEWRISTDDDCNEELINEDCADPVVDLKIEKEVPHPHYSRKTGDNDIALLKLERNVKYTSYIRPICLPTPEETTPESGSLLVVSGWGSTENGSLSDLKLKVKLPVVSNTECAAKVKNSRGVTENQLCAGGDKGKDSCKGDSGGPLMGIYGKTNSSEKNQWYQEGVIAWGMGCGRKGFPGIYTRIAKYMGWIMENIS